MYGGIAEQMLHIDACLPGDQPELRSEAVVADLTDECCFPAQLLQHGQHVAGRAAGIGLKDGVPLGAEAVLREIDQ